MRVLAIWKSCWLVPLLAVSASCGGSTSAGPTPVGPTGPTPSISLITMSARCAGPFHPGEAAPGACVFEVGGVSRDARAFADLRTFGGRADSELIRCPACGGPPWTFDVDLRIPADVAPGPQIVNVWVTDAQGQRADTTAVFQIAAR